MPRHEAPLEDPTKEDKVHSKVLALQQEQRIIWLQEVRFWRISTQAHLHSSSAGKQEALPEARVQG